MWSNTPNRSVMPPPGLDLVNRLVHPLVVERARHRRELVTELARHRRHRVRLDRLRVLPHLDHGEMIRPVGLLHDLEAQVASAPPALVAEPLERRDPVVLARRNDVDVRRDVDGVAHRGRVDRADRERDVYALVGRGVADHRDLLTRLHRARALAVSLEHLLVLPDLEDGELMGLVDALHELTAKVAAL